MISIPKEVADAIEFIWDQNQESVKHLILTNWSFLNKSYPEQYVILEKYAHDNPIKYMAALVNGYKIEFNKDMIYESNTIKLTFSSDIKNDKFNTDKPLKLAVNKGIRLISMDDAMKLSSALYDFVKELEKVKNVNQNN